ncbi:hypothetical protein [Nocardia carnea]|nr:hypothetical protein [Nocardia carnea]
MQQPAAPAVRHSIDTFVGELNEESAAMGVSPTAIPLAGRAAEVRDR